MRELNIGTKRHTTVFAYDQPGIGGANCEYIIMPTDATDIDDTLGEIGFQNGPIKVAGLNGIFNEDLIAILIDRLQGFQSGDFACRENAQAIKKLEEALRLLNIRTENRIRRGVDGTYEA